MKKPIVAIVALLVVGTGAGYFYYQTVLRYDDYTDCPVLAFRAAASSTEAAASFVTEQALGSLAIAGQCGLDCDHGNHMACVIYGLAQQKGIFLFKSPKDAQKTFKRACDRGEALACQFEGRARDLKDQEKQAAAQAKRRQANAQTLRELGQAKRRASTQIKHAIAHFNGNKGPMVSAKMVKWYEGTCRYLLYDKPYLAGHHKNTGAPTPKGAKLKEFVLAKYTGGEREPSFELIDAFFTAFKRAGIAQIKLDYRVEYKKDSELPKSHGYFRAKHAFLFNVGNVELEVYELLESSLAS